MDYREILVKMKIYFNVESNKELAEKLNISEAGIKEWNRRKKIPDRYIKMLEQENKNQNINQGNNSVQINGNVNGQIHINSSDEMSMAICQEVKKLDDDRKEYYYHLIKADVINQKLKGKI